MTRSNRIPAKIREEVYDRSLGYCEAGAPGCSYHAAHLHHVVLRSRGGRHLASNLLHVCMHCHNHIHENPAWATTRGFLASNRTGIA